MKRWAAVAAVLGGITYLVLNLLVEIYFPDHWAGSPNRLLSISYAGWSRLLWIPAALLMVGLIGIYTCVSASVGCLWKVGYILAVVGLGLDILGNLVEFWVYGLLRVPVTGEFHTGSAGSQLGYSISGYGAMSLMVGLLLLGITSLRAKLLARWRYLLFSIGFIYTSALFFYFANLMVVHAVAFGLIWVVAGWLLWQAHLPGERGNPSND